MVIGVPKERSYGERRVALTPSVIPTLVNKGVQVIVESGCGEGAGYPDEQYLEKGAKVVSHDEVFSADIILQVRGAGSASKNARYFERFRPGQTVIGILDSLYDTKSIHELAQRGVKAFALELMPRIARAQSMDVLSSMATISGYKAVIIAAEKLHRIFPLLMTAAGTLKPARVLVVGVGVAGLQAISTARRLGALVRAYDVRPQVKEQVESLGAKFVEMLLRTEVEDKWGYAKDLGEEFYSRQRELLREVVADSDVVITTALIPGKPAPVLISREMVYGMEGGSVIVDVAAERGGNCEITKPDQEIVEHGVTIFGHTNLPSTIPYHASYMYAKNISSFLLHLIKQGDNFQDEILSETLVAVGGEVVNPKIK